MAQSERNASGARFAGPEGHEAQRCGGQGCGAEEPDAGIVRRGIAAKYLYPLAVIATALLLLVTAV